MNRTFMCLRMRAGIFFLVLSAYCWSASAQMTSVTASPGSLVMGTSPIASGTASFSVVDADRGGAVAVRSGGRIFPPQAIPCDIVSGGLYNCSVPDLSVALSLRPYVRLGYNIAVFDYSSHSSYVMQGVGGVQGAVWALDTYAPAQSAPVVATALSTGSVVPSFCRGAALFYTQTNPSVGYDCVGNVFVQRTSSGGNSVSITWRNAYGSGTTYAVNDAVTYGGSSYISLQANNSAHQPDSSPAWWGMLAAKGDAGPAGTAGVAGLTGAKGDTGATGTQGPKGDTGSAGTTGATGPKGDTGAPGAAATIAFGSVTTADPGTPASATNSGNSSAAVINFTIPKGDTGAPGAKGDTGAPGATGVAGSAYSLQFNNAGALGGIVNGTTTRKFVLQTTGAPFMDVIQSGDLPAATPAAQGAVVLPTGQSSNVLAKAAITGQYADLQGTPVAPILATNLMALYEFNDTSGTVLKDYSGNGRDGTLTGFPTRDGYGYTYTSSAGQYVDVPTSLNAALTIHEVINFPLTITGVYDNNSILPILGNSNSAGTAGFELWAFGTNSSAGNYSVTAFNTATGNQISTTDSYWAGLHVLTVTCPAAAKPLLYLDGYPINNTYASTVVSCNGLQTAGNYRFGTTARNNTGPNTYTYYGAAFYSVVQDPGTVAATANALRAMAVARGVQVVPLPIITPSPKYFASGDSITCGFPQGGCVVGASSPIGYPYIATTQTNKTYTPIAYGVPGNVVTQAIITEPYRAWPQCRSIGGGSINSLFMGTNDFTSQNVLGAVVSDRQASFAKGSTASGCRPFLIGMLSRSGNAAGAVAWDTRMIQKNAEDRAQWANWGYSAYVDWGTDPILGAVGAFQGAVPFTCTLTSGQATCTLTAGTITTQNYGGVVNGTGVQNGTTITSISGSTITLSATATTSGSQSLTSTGNTWTIDGTHPTATAGYNRMGAAVACVINAMDGSSPTQMNQTPVTTSATATCADGGRLIDATAGNVTYTLPTAMYQTGRRVKYCNVTTFGSNTVTLAAPSDFPINNVSGMTTLSISQGACINLEAAWNGLTTTSTGAFWRVN